MNSTSKPPGASDQPAGDGQGPDVPTEPAPPMAPGDQAPPGALGTGENTCPRCAGTGRVGAQPCPACNGSGVVTEQIGGA